MKGVIVILLLLVSSICRSQDSTQNLLDYNEWNGYGMINEPLTCWSAADPGYCGPLPAVGAFTPDSINFSYGLADLYQLISIQTALNAAGNSIIITGFNFSFTAKNGNGWDDGRTDYLRAYANFYDSSNTLLEAYNYDLQYQFNWSNFNYTETFADPYRIYELDNVRVGFVGRDANFWAGFYGPEVNSMSFSLNYGPDPCANDPFSSPSCPNFQEALLELQCSTDPLSSIECPGYLEASLAADVDEPEQEDEEPIEEEELIADIEEPLQEEIIDDIDEPIETAQEESEEEVFEEEVDNEEEIAEVNKDTPSSSLLKLILSIVETSTSEDSLSQPPTTATPLAINQTIEQSNAKPTSESRIADISALVEPSNDITVETDNLDPDMLIVTETTVEEEIKLEPIQEISDTADVITEIKEISNTTDQVISQEEGNKENNSTIEDKTAAETVNDNNLIFGDTQSTTYETTEQDQTLFSLQQNLEDDNTLESAENELLEISQPLIDLVVVNNNAATVFSNNSMQQVLATGGTITEILNTVVPNFSKYDIKPPAQEEQVQTAKVENAIQTMSQEEIEQQAQDRIGSMDPEAQAIALQLIAYRPGFDTYGGTLQDVEFYKSKDLYLNNKVQNDRNSMLQLIGVDNKHEQMVEMQFK